MNGVSWMFSAGSNQLGTSVVWTAQVICPSGPAAPAAAVQSDIIETRRLTEKPRTRLMIGASVLELHLFVRRRVRVAGDQSNPGFLDARSHAGDDRRFPQRRKDDLVVDELLDAVEGGLAPLAIHLADLLAEESIDVRVTSIDVGPAGRHERVDPRGRVAEGAGADVDQILQLLLRERLEERGTLERPELRPYARGSQIVDHRFGTGEGDVTVEVAGVESKCRCDR